MISLLLTLLLCAAQPVKQKSNMCKADFKGLVIESVFRILFTGAWISLPLSALCRDSQNSVKENRQNLQENKPDISSVVYLLCVSVLCSRMTAYKAICYARK